MIFFEVILFISFFLFFHTWIGYPLILMVLQMTGGKRRKCGKSTSSPSVSIVIAAYNASGKIINKISNAARLDYPSDRLEIIVVSDGSADKTVEEAISSGQANLRVLELPKNQGKSSAQNEGVLHARGEIIVFTDVDSNLDKAFLLNVIPYFSDRNVACVGGIAVHKTKGGSISSSQGLYWKLEQFIRRSESDLGVLISLSGWGFAVRKEDFVPLDDDTGDDMVLPMELALRGKISVIAPNAFVTDTMPDSFRGELKARQRITLRNLTALMRRKGLLNPFRDFLMAFSLWSHKLLRWLSPVLLLVAFLSTMALAVLHSSMIFKFLLALQLACYAICVFGFISIFTKIKIPITGQLASFMLANIGFFLGVMKYVTGKKIRSYSNNE